MNANVKFLATLAFALNILLQQPPTAVPMLPASTSILYSERAEDKGGDEEGIRILQDTDVVCVNFAPVDKGSIKKGASLITNIRLSPLIGFGVASAHLHRIYQVFPP